MQISFEHNFLFVHIPKTGGTSIRSALEPYQTDTASAFPNPLLRQIGINVNHYLGGYRSFQFRKHERIKTVARLLPANAFDSLFKFCFVRNPWDLLVSNYSYVKSNKKHKRHRRMSRMDFREFVEFAVAKEIGFQKPIVSSTSGDLLVNRVGKFETLNEDFESIASIIQIEATLPHLNRVKKQLRDIASVARLLTVSLRASSPISCSIGYQEKLSAASPASYPCKRRAISSFTADASAGRYAGGLANLQSIASFDS